MSAARNFDVTTSQSRTGAVINVSMVPSLNSSKQSHRDHRKQEEVRDPEKDRVKKYLNNRVFRRCPVQNCNCKPERQSVQDQEKKQNNVGNWRIVENRQLPLEQNNQASHRASVDLSALAIL